MGEHAALARQVQALPQLVEQEQQLMHPGGAVAGRVDADHRIAAAKQQPIDRGGQDAGRVVGGVVRLQPCGEAAR